MQSNHNAITGVLHQRQSAELYQLRRYFPDVALAELIEQFWLVDWDLRGQANHIQQNLPDPNFHLVINNGTASLLGPVSKSYSYEMQGKGQIIGVKFALGALAERLDFKPADFIDKQLKVEQVFNVDISRMLSELSAANSDQQRVAYCNPALNPLLLRHLCKVPECGNWLVLSNSNQTSPGLSCYLNAAIFRCRPFSVVFACI